MSVLKNFQSDSVTEHEFVVMGNCLTICNLSTIFFSRIKVINMEIDIVYEENI